MNDLALTDTGTAAPAAYGSRTAPDSLTIQRLLPGPVERVWAYLTESELRRQWFASGTMELRPGASFELVWRNAELTDPPGERPADKAEEHRKTCTITAVEAPRLLAFEFGGDGTVEITLEKRGERVLLTLIHSGLTTRGLLLGVSAGWHAHLDILVARLCGERPAPFWEHYATLRAEYEARLGD
jgi:uncharacterized protein YndB with AHSA1/START domain